MAGCPIAESLVAEKQLDFVVVCAHGGSCICLMLAMKYESDCHGGGQNYDPPCAVCRRPGSSFHMWVKSVSYFRTAP
jgi:hypothetical protein